MTSSYFDTSETVHNKGIPMDEWFQLLVDRNLGSTEFIRYYIMKMSKQTGQSPEKCGYMIFQVHLMNPTKHFIHVLAISLAIIEDHIPPEREDVDSFSNAIKLLETTGWGQSYSEQTFYSIFELNTKLSITQVTQIGMAILG